MEVEGGESVVEVHQGCWCSVGVYFLVLLVVSVACGSWHGVVEQSLLAGCLGYWEGLEGKQKPVIVGWPGSGFGSMMNGYVEIPSFVY